jgi:hypothetical protein
MVMCGSYRSGIQDRNRDRLNTSFTRITAHTTRAFTITSFQKGRSWKRHVPRRRLQDGSFLAVKLRQSYPSAMTPFAGLSARASSMPCGSGRDACVFWESRSNGASTHQPKAFALIATVRRRRRFANLLCRTLLLASTADVGEVLHERPHLLRR